jgi:murein L,D-transpeptidase YafK
MVRKLGVIAAILVLGALAVYQYRPEGSLPPGSQADQVVVYKAKRTLTLMQGGRPLKAYHVSLGANPVGPKNQEGDEKTPEGRYVLDYRNPNSRFHLSIHVSYPNAADQEAARHAGVRPGGAIMIHGIQNGLGWIGRLHRFWNWTDGCMAVTNSEIEEIWRAVPDGTPIEIYP